MKGKTYTFEIRPDGRPGIWGWNWTRLKKKQEKKKLDVTRRVDPTTRLTQQNPVANLLTFLLLF